jgi:hypothetical protein
LKALLSKGGDASSNAAEIIYEFVATENLPEKQLNDNDNDGDKK